MLIEGFYTIEQFAIRGSDIDALITLNPDHEVYQGHFPGQPVVPGVIQLQMIKEILTKAVEKELLFGFISSAKYLSIIVPSDNPQLEISIHYEPTDTGDYMIRGQIGSGETVFTKIRGILSVQL